MERVRVSSSKGLKILASWREEVLFAVRDDNLWPDAETGAV